MKNKFNQIVLLALRPLNNRKADADADVEIAGKAFSWGKFAVLVVVGIALVALAYGLLGGFSATISNKITELQGFINGNPITP